MAGTHCINPEFELRSITRAWVGRRGAGWQHKPHRGEEV
jgi:hypothetical protein